MKVFSKKEFLWTFSERVVTLIGGMALMKILAIGLSIEEYGYYSLVTSICALVIMLPFGSLLQGVSRYVSIYKENPLKYNKFVKSTLELFFLISAFYILLAVIIRYSSSLDSKWEDIYYLLVFFIFSEMLKSLYKTLNNANRRRLNLTVSSFLEFIVKVVFLYILWKANGIIDIESVLLILILSNMISILILFKGNKVLNISRINARSSKNFILRMWIFSAPLVVWSIFGWLRDMSNRWYLDYFLDKESVALFAMIGSIAMIAPVALHGLIDAYLIPILYQKDKENKQYAGVILSRLLPSILLFFLLSFTIVFFYKNEIILIIADYKYLKLSWMLPWMFLTFSVYSLSMIATYELFTHKQTKRLLISSIVPGAVSIVCGYYFIKKYGLDGAFYNYIVTYLSYSILTFMAVYRYRIYQRKSEKC
jgi:O-antigen/teichoic acid export membrane protein